VTHQAVERDQTSGHELVVALGLGVLEEALDDRMMALAVERLAEVLENLAASPRARVLLPTIGERRQIF